MQSRGLWGSSGLRQTVAYHITEDSTLLSIFIIFILFNYAVACGGDRYYYQYLDLQEVKWGGKDWIDLAQDRDRWWVQ